MWETRVRSLGWKDPLEKEMATHSSTLAWKSHGWRSVVSYSPQVAKSRTQLSGFTFTFTFTLGSITMNKASGGDGIAPELLHILKDDAVKMLYSICQQIWKTQWWPQEWKGQFLYQSRRKAKPKNVKSTTQLHSFHTLARKYTKSFKLGFNNMWTENFQMLNLDLEKAEETDQAANICWVIKKAREFQKNINFCLID